MNKSQFYKSLGGTIRLIRKAKRINQNKAAAAIGIHQTAFCRVEQGKQRLLAHEALLLSELLDIDIKKLLLSARPKKPRT